MSHFYSEFDRYPIRSTSGYSTYASTGGVNILKVGSGFLHSVTFSQLDAAPTAGDITLYDFAGANIYASGGTVLLRHSQTTGVFMPTTVTLNVPFTNGLALGFTAPIKDVNVLVSFK